MHTFTANSRASLVAQMVRICKAGDLGSIPGLEDPLEEGMATHSSILTWRIPWTRAAWQATADGVAQSQTRLND